jgi:hypothetical protein
MLAAMEKVEEPMESIQLMQPTQSKPAPWVQPQSQASKKRKLGDFVSGLEEMMKPQAQAKPGNELLDSQELVGLVNYSNMKLRPRTKAVFEGEDKNYMKDNMN